ncbi:MAG TPA: NADH-quinone oxidoreductase subunit NuoE [Thermoanaerobaculaceae bacterium]|nr:NADH-quinone oxidoreductase subunit NuoE [Thermoanaerobaculaceae bacterium]
MEQASKVQQVIDRFERAGRDSLIPILQAVQHEQGYLSEDAVASISRHLAIPASKVYGVATFYNQFRFQPKGKYHILICRGTACHVKGSAKVLDAIRKHLKVEPGRTTRDKLFSLETVACMGACALSPVLCINDEFHAKVSPAKAIKLIEACRELEAARPAATA